MSCRRLQATMESLARKRQKEFETQTKWNNQTEYYKTWNRHNNQFQNWTSNEYYETSLNQYDEEKKKEWKQQTLETRRDKLRKLYFEEEQDYDLEISQSPRERRSGHYKLNETPTEVLKDVNVGLKIVEDDRKRHEAELKLYHKWRNENPVVRDYEANQSKAGLKLAWLDQQIEKRMEQEKTEEEIKQMIEDRNKLIKEEEELDKQELEERDRREKDMMSQIELQIRLFKLKDAEAERLKDEELRATMKKNEIEEIIARRNEEAKRRRQCEVALFNVNQSKMKLRRKAVEVEKQLREESGMIEAILASESAEEIMNEEKRKEAKDAIMAYLQYVRDQQQLEDQRQKYISFIFDSEAKQMWEKQQRIWCEEQAARDKLLDDVLTGIKEQIQDKINRNLEEQRSLLRDREEMLKTIEESDQQMRLVKEAMNRKKLERKMELDKQINDKRLQDCEKKMEEEKKKQEELDKIRKEEEKLKQELMQMQRKPYHPSNLNRRIIW